MSQFAHGIRSIDLQTCSTDENEEMATVWLIGKCYSDVAAQYSAYMSHFQSILWMTYRKDFAQLNPYEYTTDAGWGCMLRSAQMILCQAYMRHLLGTSWRLQINESLDPGFVKLLKWFVDSPDKECLYSLHNMVKIGMQYDKLPGEWYGPTTASQVVRDLVNLHSKELQGALSTYVPQEGVIYSDEVFELCTHGEPPVEETKTNDSQSGSSISQAFFDPLLNPPKHTKDLNRPWTTAILILIPLRLGLDSINEAYIPALKKVFEMPQCVGIIGGKRAHSVYFIGVQGSNLHLLDPHTVQPTPDLNSSFPTATHIRTIHSSTPLVIDINNIDTSLAMGFYVRDRDDYKDFCDRVSKLGKECTFPFSIADTRPDYSNDMDMGGLSDSGFESSNGDADDEYVLL